MPVAREQPPGELCGRSAPRARRAYAVSLGHSAWCVRDTEARRYGGTRVAAVFNGFFITVE
jgi:hypothetical protein